MSCDLKNFNLLYILSCCFFRLQYLQLSPVVPNLRAQLQPQIPQTRIFSVLLKKVGEGRHFCDALFYLLHPFNAVIVYISDTPQNSPYKPLKLPAGALRGRNNTTPPQGQNGGAIPRTRKLSNSSIQSDVSFRLPNWDAGSVSFHVIFKSLSKILARMGHWANL